VIDTPNDDRCPEDLDDPAAELNDLPDRLECLNCGMCEWCIERSITAAEEHNE
jgi:hypothetical protein